MKVHSLSRHLPACLIFLLTMSAARASENRFWLVNQSDFGAKRGFYLAFENSSAGDAPCTLRTLKLIWGVADGNNWRFLSTPPGGWRYDHDYTVHATARPTGARFLLDGTPVGQSPDSLSPDSGAVLAGDIPGWAHGPADYCVVPARVTVTPTGGKPLTFDFPHLSTSQMLFEPQTPKRAENWTVAPGQSLTVDATFRLTRPPDDLHALAPFVDRYGQAIAPNWPGKTAHDADLTAARADEDKRLKAWGKPLAEYDAYGGWRKAGWHGQATGTFQAVRHDSVWWLLTPDGNPCFYTSVCSAPALKWETTPISGREYLYAELPPHDGPTAAAWGGDAWGQDPGIQSLAFCTVNLIRKYGPDWQDAFRRQTVRRMRAWGFSGLGKWCDLMPGVPSLPVLNRGGVPSLPGGHPDPFDPATQTKLHDVLAAQITPHASDPAVVAWSLGNEHDEIITAAEIRGILRLGADVPAKRALVDEALNTLYGGDFPKLVVAWGIQVMAPTREALYRTVSFRLPDADVEALRRFYADRYYALIEQTVKALDSRHLYAGFWIVPGWWENEEDWRLIARHCDILGYDNYAFRFADARLTRLIQEAGKPVLCGEFSFPPQYRGTRGFGLYDAAWAGDDADAGRLYARYVDGAAQNPFCVGLAWFQYRDEPLTGRGPGHGPGLLYGEHYAFGVVDIADTPKWDLVSAMRRANLAAAGLHNTKGNSTR